MNDITALAQTEINDALAQLKQLSEYPTPSTQYARVLRKYITSLVEALEKTQKSNEFLKGQLSELANFNPDWDKLEASYESWREIAAELLVAKERIAELESEVKFPGVMRCNLCGFSRSHVVVTPGGMRAGESVPESCPNGCGPLWHDTYRRQYNELYDAYKELESRTVTPEIRNILKDHRIGELVTELRDIAVDYHASDSLREKIARTVRAAMLVPEEPAPDMIAAALESRTVTVKLPEVRITIAESKLRNLTYQQLDAYNAGATRAAVKLSQVLADAGIQVIEGKGQ